MSKEFDMEKYFNELRKDPKHHLGLGDIRLTIGMQDEIVAEWIRCLKEVERLEDEIFWLEDEIEQLESELGEV